MSQKVKDKIKEIGLENYITNHFLKEARIDNFFTALLSFVLGVGFIVIPRIFNWGLDQVIVAFGLSLVFFY